MTPADASISLRLIEEVSLTSGSTISYTIHARAGPSGPVLALLLLPPGPRHPAGYLLPLLRGERFRPRLASLLPSQAPYLYQLIELYKGICLAAQHTSSASLIDLAIFFVVNDTSATLKMAYFSSSDLHAYAIRQDRLEKAARGHATRAMATTTIFLSHSHQDRDLVQGTINLLAGQGIAVYVDWLDAGMPEITSAETAARIKQFIALNKRFVLLATEASLASRWVPWELGCADGIKGPGHMAILPVTRPPHTFKGNEYLNLYSRILIANEGIIGVFQPGQDQGVTLADWLRS